MEELLQYITDCGPMHLPDNFSRHSPFLMRLNVKNIPIRESAVPPILPRRPAWYKAQNHHMSAYKENLHSKIDNLQMPASLNCSNPHCQSRDHKEERDQYMLDVLGSLCDAAKEEIPLTKGGKPTSSNGDDNISNVIPDWTIK